MDWNGRLHLEPDPCRRGLHETQVYLLGSTRLFQPAFVWAMCDEIDRADALPEPDGQCQQGLDVPSGSQGQKDCKLHFHVQHRRGGFLLQVQEAAGTAAWVSGFENWGCKAPIKWAAAPLKSGSTRASLLVKLSMYMQHQLSICFRGKSYKGSRGAQGNPSVSPGSTRNLSIDEQSGSGKSKRIIRRM